MHEIEVKATLRDRDSIMEKLRELGCEFSKSVTQDDTLYAERVGSIEEYNANAAFLRIRVTDGAKVLFTLKYDKDSEGDPHTTPIEHEVEIDSREEMEKIIFALGQQEVLRIKKTRMKTKHKEWEICIDEVEGLGSFIEVEEMGSIDDASRIHEDMLAFLGKLGIAQEDMFTKRYDILLLEKQGKV